MKLFAAFANDRTRSGGLQSAVRKRSLPPLRTADATAISSRAVSRKSRRSHSDGYSFFGRSKGNRITSRMDSAPVSSIVSLSIPIPTPPAGGIPCSRANRMTRSCNVSVCSNRPAKRSRTSTRNFCSLLKRNAACWWLRNRDRQARNVAYRRRIHPRRDSISFAATEKCSLAFVSDVIWERRLVKYRCSFRCPQRRSLSFARRTGEPPLLVLSFANAANNFIAVFNRLLVCRSGRTRETPASCGGGCVGRDAS